MVLGDPPQATLLLDIGIVLIVAQLSSEVFKKLRLSGLAGSILAGALIGPFAFDIVTDVTTINLLAFLGALLILFVVGLEFEAQSFWQAGKAAFLLTTFGVLASLLLGYLAGLYLGWSPRASFLLGVMLAPSGTSVVAALLTELGKASTRWGSTILTACVIDDVEGVILLTIGLALTPQETTPYGIVSVGGSVTLFVLLAIFLGSRVMPGVVTRLERRTTDETLFTILLALGMLLAFGATRFGVAAITGAFIMGSIIPAKKIGEKMVHRIGFMKEVFASIFFTTVGMSLNPFDFLTIPWTLTTVLVVGLAGRLAGGVTGALLAGFRGRPAAVATLALIGRAEMSLIVAKQAVDTGLATGELLTAAAFIVLISAVFFVPIFRKQALASP